MAIPIMLLVLVAADAPKNLIDDGDFEDPDVGDMYQQYDKGDTIGNWHVDSGSVDLTGKWWDAASGKQSLDLNGDKTGSISQEIETAPGQSYVIRLAMSGNPDNENPEKATMKVEWNGKVIAELSCDREYGKHHQMKWNRYSFAVKASDAKSTLKFISTTDGGWGPLIDDVSVAEGDILDEEKPSTQPTTAP